MIVESALTCNVVFFLVNSYMLLITGNVGNMRIVLGQLITMCNSRN
jgi:hypothetical protein